MQMYASIMENENDNTTNENTTNNISEMGNKQFHNSLI